MHGQREPHSLLLGTVAMWAAVCGALLGCGVSPDVARQQARLGERLFTTGSEACGMRPRMVRSCPSARVDSRFQGLWRGSALRPDGTQAEDPASSIYVDQCFAYMFQSSERSLVVGPGCVAGMGPQGLVEAVALVAQGGGLRVGGCTGTPMTLQLTEDGENLMRLAVDGYESRQFRRVARDEVTPVELDLLTFCEPGHFAGVPSWLASEGEGRLASVVAEHRPGMPADELMGGLSPLARLAWAMLAVLDSPADLRARLARLHDTGESLDSFITRSLELLGTRITDDYASSVSLEHLMTGVASVLGHDPNLQWAIVAADWTLAHQTH